MTDLEITRLCAEAMEYEVEYGSRQDNASTLYIVENGRSVGVYTPLHDDAQAMALVKRHRIHLTWSATSSGEVWKSNTSECDLKGKRHETSHSHLNRAICECVAKLQQAKEPHVQT